MATIRPERQTDIPELRTRAISAFKDAPYLDGIEADIIDVLRETGHLFLSLVAEIDGAIVGNIVLSPITIDGKNCGWHGLGPLWVSTDARGKGIATALVAAGLEQSKQRGSKGCATVGDHGFYGRFGLQALAGLHLIGAPARNFLCLSHSDPHPTGEVVFQDVFYSAHT